MVLNVTNQCNLSCTYCYEYGEDKIVDTENGKQPKFMSEETARRASSSCCAESGDDPMAHITFFGGETLMNFPVLQDDDRLRAAARAAEVGKEIDFSLTTNATLLKPDVIEFLADERRRRDDLDRRPAGDPGQVPRLPATATAATTWWRRRSRRCWRGTGRGRSARASRSTGRRST